VAAPVAVAVVSWNTRELLARCLESLAGEVEAGRAEVWVVDNASTDGSAELVAERFGWVRLERAGVNLGFGAAVNRVAGRTQTPWLAMANADVRVRPGALEALLAAGAADPRAGALAPRLLLPDGRAQHSVFAFPGVSFALGLNLGALGLVPGLADRLAVPGSWDPERPRRVPWAIGAFLLVRREAWNAAGGFDESQWLYAEDLDLGWRLRRAGWGTRYVPEAVVEHEAAAATGQAFGPGRTERWQRATYAWMLQRRGWLRTRTVAAVNLAGAALRWAALTPLAWARPGRFGPRRRELAGWTRAHATGLQPARRLRAQR
jgi:N-acetylglucosaminyl-diphospho-decaprenol L-rhamnosyltransferase